jgi:predicted glycogen debranching enzyme
MVADRSFDSGFCDERLRETAMSTTTSVPNDASATLTTTTHSLRRVRWSREEASDPLPLVRREWIVTNGRGGYASGTLAGVATRRYHGYLVAALPEPLGRMMMLNQLVETIQRPDGTSVRLGGREVPGSLEVPDAQWLTEFRLEDGLPVWEFDLGTHRYEKRLVLPHHQNTTHVIYRLLEGEGPLRLRLGPVINIRPHDAPVDTPLQGPYTLQVTESRFEIRCARDVCAPLRLRTWEPEPLAHYHPRTLRTRFFRLESERGYPERGDLWTPGSFELELTTDRSACFTVSAEPWAKIEAMEPLEALRAEQSRRRQLVETAGANDRPAPLAELVLAADQFLIAPVGRTEDAARVEARGGELRTVIAGYHWFTDWGRDTMISLEGLTLSTGRFRLAADILRTFSQYVRDGLIPNFFPDGSAEGVYHTADATLWFFHAMDRYLAATGDLVMRDDLLRVFHDIVEHHMRGTAFGIGVDPSDHLLKQGAPGYQLTWMDAKCDGWVVTPRRGKAVEINGLWYNALRLLEGWSRETGNVERADRLAAEAEAVRESFNRRFWNGDTDCLFDVVDDLESGTDDPAIRPNQLMAFSLRHPVLDERHWRSVLEVATRTLLTPVGLRSLAPGHPDYKPNYHGDLRTRDAAYHQGTVWAWLIGPYVDAYLKVHPGDLAGARATLQGLVEHLGDAGVGTLSEVFDAEAPYTPRGCMAQAWSVAELLRCWRATEPPSAS